MAVASGAAASVSGFRLLPAGATLHRFCDLSTARRPRAQLPVAQPSPLPGDRVIRPQETRTASSAANPDGPHTSRNQPARKRPRKNFRKSVGVRWGYGSYL